MKRWSMLVLLLVAGSLVWTNFTGAGRAGPLAGTENVYPELPPASIKKFTQRFAGGQRACALVRGDHQKPTDNLSMEVFDDTQRLVAKDDGQGYFAVAVWYPPQDGEYTIIVKHTLHDENKCYLVIK